MDSNPAPDLQNCKTFKIASSDDKSYSLKFFVKSEKIEIYISNNNSIYLSYKASFTIDELHKLNKYFRQFDTINEAYDFLINIEKIEEIINIKVEDKFINLKLSLPKISKAKMQIEINFIIPVVEIKESDLIIKLCEKMEKIDILEKKINYIFSILRKTEKNFKDYEIISKNIKNIESNIVTIEDFATVQIGIREKLNKTIKEAKLLYRASRDGDSAQFHSKCDGKKNTVTFVQAKNGRKFGGFANQAFNSNNSWISDPNCFVFSLFYNECYYYNNNGYMIYGSSSYGPLWGGVSSYDLYLASGCLNNTTSTSNQQSFNYLNRVNALTGSSNFQAEDYETYELILE
jgi:hypothetical protein